MKIRYDFFFRFMTILVFLAFICAIDFSSELAAEDKKASEIQVKVDQAHLIRLPRAGTDIILGNPSIADISMRNSTLMVITGKSFGTTNLIVLDSKTKKILDVRLNVVSSKKSNIVSLYNGSGRKSYNCTPNCQSILVVGDQKEYFESISTAIVNKIGTATKTTTAPPEGQ